LRRSAETPLRQISARPVRSLPRDFSVMPPEKFQFKLFNPPRVWQFIRVILGENVTRLDKQNG
jgi:hypothetical protein